MTMSYREFIWLFYLAMISETKKIPLWQMKRSLNDVSVWLEPKVTNNASSY